MGQLILERQQSLIAALVDGHTQIDQSQITRNSVLTEREVFDGIFQKPLQGIHSILVNIATRYWCLLPGSVAVTGPYLLSSVTSAII